MLFALVGPALGQSGGGESGGEPPTLRPDLPSDLARFPALDSWIRIDAQGHATMFTGKAELGQGIRTALAQLAADELDLPLARVTLVTHTTRPTRAGDLLAG